jgi:hypothetical protein
MAKKEIGWKRRSETGERLEIYVRHAGDRWIFHTRPGRSEQWRVVEDPPLADWLELLDAVGRRTGRQLLRPAEEASLKKLILERFPEANLTTGPEDA